MAEPALRLVHDADHAKHNGEIRCDLCIEHVKRAAQILNDLESAEHDLRVVRRQRDKARQELADLQAGDADIQKEAQEVYAYWKRRCRPSARTFKGKRQEKVTARLKDGYTVADLKLAIDGAAVGAYEKDGVRYDDLELICRDAVKVDAFMTKAGLAPETAPAVEWTTSMAFSSFLAALVREYKNAALPGQAPDYDPVEDEWTCWCPSCLVTDRMTLHLKLDDDRLVWCERCDIDEVRLTRALLS